MIPAAHFRQQQQRVRSLIGRIEQELLRHEAGQDATMIVLDVARLTGMLAVHVAQVDRTVVPTMLAGPPGSADRTLAHRFRAEFGDLASLATLFARRWGTSASIAADPIAFRIDVRQLVEAIEERFEREERDLFGLDERAREGMSLAEAPERPPVRAAT